jgi:hypothetical protein
VRAAPERKEISFAVEHRFKAPFIEKYKEKEKEK